jgi:dihydroxyacetone kinase-like predicted kinase
MIPFDPGRGADDNAAAMNDALEHVATGAVTVASRDAEFDWIAVRKGDYLALLDDEPIASAASLEEAARAVVSRLLEAPRDILTLLTGADQPELGGLVSALEQEHPDLELEVHEGGQPHYPLLLGAE